jgi:acetylornithine deacetylase/succinyl-diaminopimelate desuccinylase-like protein
VFPNAPNVVPGLVKHTIEFRDLSEETLRRLGEAAKQRAQEIAAQTGTQITITQIEHLRPALATAAIQKQIEAAAAGLGLKTMHLPSGAGHDAQNIAQSCRPGKRLRTARMCCCKLSCGLTQPEAGAEVAGVESIRHTGSKVLPNKNTQDPCCR